MLIKLKKAQSTAEYAILFALVIAAAMGVQNYVRKGLQARIYDAVNDFVEHTGGTTYQWEGTEAVKTTHSQHSHKTFKEDYEDSETPYVYTEERGATYSRREAK